MTQYVFGTGQLFATPVGGGAPLRFGALQDVSIDLSADTKELYGQYQYSLDAARGKTKVEWKASTGNIDVAAFNSIYFGQTVDSGAAGGELIQAFNEAGTVPASTAYTITVANAAKFVMDLGVYNATTGLPLKQVSTNPATGEYSVSALGVYTFNIAQASTNMLLNYLYEGTTGGSVTVTNQLMGSTPRFQLVATQLYKGKSFTMILYSAISDKMSLPLKQDDYLISEISGMAHADDANRVLKMSTTSIVGGGS